uniref:F-box domain-containing protein n=1 Tax=Guillardia theta TaxID=55529 RepID=A0A6U5YUA4_GUITH|mmetsp:Transcript_22711/g.74254  ORF Transcript_22711/g.74254 Transcript_22711/m.74254 type:complete len:744 (+) Transcript_22711:85-2316(+)
MHVSNTSSHCYERSSIEEFAQLEVDQSAEEWDGREGRDLPETSRGRERMRSSLAPLSPEILSFPLSPVSLSPCLQIGSIACAGCDFDGLHQENGFHWSTSSKRPRKGDWSEVCVNPFPSRRCSEFMQFRPSELALLLEYLPFRNLMIARMTNRLFREACRYIYKIDLGEISALWSGRKICDNLLPIFAGPLVISGMKFGRSLNSKKLIKLSNEGILRLKSLSWGFPYRIFSSRAQKISEVIRCCNLQELDLVGTTSLRASGVLKIFANMSTATSLQTLTLRGCKIGPSGARALAVGMEAGCSITSLDLGDNSIGTEGCTALSFPLKATSKCAIKYLNLSSNEIRNDGLSALSPGLLTNTSLVCLRLAMNYIRPQGAMILTEFLDQCTALRELELGYNLIRCHGCSLLSAALTRMNSLTHLGLRRNEVAAEGATSISRSLWKNTCLQSLDLGLNSIGMGGAQNFGWALGYNSTLQSLRLDWNDLRGNSILLMPASTRGEGFRLSELDLSCNKLSNDGASNLSEALLNLNWGSKKQVLHIRGNAVGMVGLRSLLPVLEPDEEGALDLSDNDIGDEGCKIFARDRPNLLLGLRRLNLSGNRITSAGLFDLAKALRTSTTLEEINLSRNQITVLPNLLACPPRLQRILVFNNDTLQLPPPEIVRLGPAAIVAYLQRGLAQERFNLCDCCSRTICMKRKWMERKLDEEEQEGRQQQEEGMEEEAEEGEEGEEVQQQRLSLMEEPEDSD